MWDNPSGSGDMERVQPRNQRMLSGILAWSSGTHLPQFGSLTAGPLSNVHALKCDPFHDDDEVVQEHVTEHMRRLGHDCGLSYEDITEQDDLL